MKSDRFSLKRSFAAIKSKPSQVVKWTCALLAVALLSSLSAADENLPDINAKEYSARVEKRSTSGRVYLLSVPNPSQPLPADGRIILLKQGGVPVMAFRVLKTYPDKTQFAGKWLRRYGDVQQLSPGSQYDAFEKISDREAAPPTPPLTRQDQKDLKEVEAPAPTPPVVAAAPPPVLAVPPTPEVAAQQAAPPPAAPPAAPPLPVEPTPPLPPTAPLTPEVAAPATPPVPAPTAETAAPPAEAAPAPPVEAEAATPPPPADLAGPAQKTETPSDIPAPGTSPAPKTKSFDQDLDATTSPQPEASPDLSGDDMSSIMVEEVKHFEEDNNAISVGVALYRNILNSYITNPPTPVTSVSIYNSAGTIRYSRTLAHRLHFKSKSLQDDLSVDGTLGFYKYLGSSSNGDTYTVMPASLALRYTLLTSENFGFFGYAGFVQNLVIASINPDSQVNQGLGSFLPDIGVGMLFRIGPSWYMRGDAGLDLFEFSIALRF